MKPTTDEVLAWAREAGFEVTVTATIRPYLESVADLAYAAGAAAMQERCAKVCFDWGEASGVHLSATIRALGDDE